MTHEAIMKHIHDQAVKTLEQLRRGTDEYLATISTVELDPPACRRCGHDIDNVCGECMTAGLRRAAEAADGRANAAAEREARITTKCEIYERALRTITDAAKGEDADPWGGEQECAAIAAQALAAAAAIGAKS